MQPATDLSVSIFSGSNVSSPFPLRGMGEAGLQVPGLTSCQLLIDVAADVSSTSFRPVYGVQSLGASFAWPIGPGPGALSFGDLVRGFRYGRLRTSVNQAQDRTFVLTVRP